MKDSESDMEGFADSVFELVLSVFVEKKEDDAQDGKALFAYIVTACLCVMVDRRGSAKLCSSKQVAHKLSGVLYGASCFFACYVLKDNREG